MGRKVLFYLWCVIALFFVTKKFFGLNEDAILSPVPENIYAMTQSTPTPQPQKLLAMAQLIEANLKEAPGEYGIVIKDLHTNETYTYNEHRLFETASLYKLWVMAEVYRQIEQGNLTEDQVLSQSIPSLNRAFGLSDDVAEQTSGGISLSVENALHQMITISHNYAAMLLTAKIRLSKVTSFLNDYKFSESKVGTNSSNPTVTASDMAKFLELVYTKKLVNAELSEKMLVLLKDQQLNNKLPKYLPQETIVAHKTGELGAFTHDAGIVYTPKGDYIIVVLSKYSVPKDAEEQIAQISKSVYDYLSK